MLGLKQIFSSLNIKSVHSSIPKRSISRRDLVMKKMGFPERPKKPPSGFLSYCKACRAQVTAQNPDMTPQDVIRMLSKRWQKEPDSEKQKYIKDFEAKMKVYKADVEKFNKILSTEAKEEMEELLAEEDTKRSQQSLLKKLKEKEKELKRPKKPLTAFLAYISKEYDTSKGPEVVKQASETWKVLPESQKEKYKAEYIKEMKKYKEDMLKWEQEMLEQGNIDFVSLKSIRQKLHSFA